jgi:hypothetical protein
MVSNQRASTGKVFGSGPGHSVTNHLSPPTIPAPGVYVTKPYAMIVVVPGEVHDPIDFPPTLHPGMPLARPRLEFTPMKPSAKR